MARRKQMHPKSFKDNQVEFVRDDQEMQFRIFAKQFDLISPSEHVLIHENRRITDRIDSFQLLDKKDNRLGLCSSDTRELPTNFFQNQHKSSLISETHFCPRQLFVEMHRDEIVKIKDEPNEMKWFICDFCGVRYRCEKTRNAHQKSYCPERETRRTCPTDLSMKRKFDEISRFSTLSKPLDLSKPKKFKQIDTQIYRCRFCSIEFRSLKTLRAHQENYCVEYRKQMNFSEQSLTCRRCQYRSETLSQMKMHWKLCSNDEFVPISLTSNFLFKCFICSAMFDEENVLLNHMGSVHSNINSIECLACRSRFCSRWNLIRHLKSSHTNIKIDENHFEIKDLKICFRPQIEMNSFVCRFCFVQFTNSDTFQQHVNFYCSSRPSNPKEFLPKKTFCSTCQVSFHEKTSYDTHKLHYCPKKSSSSVKTEV